MTVGHSPQSSTTVSGIVIGLMSVPERVETMVKVNVDTPSDGLIVKLPV